MTGITRYRFEPVNSMALAAHIVRKSGEFGISINVTKLMKLMYCAYGSVLGKYCCRLTDEYPVCFPHGAVFAEVLKSVQFFGLEAFAAAKVSEIDELPECIRELLDVSIGIFGRHESAALVGWLTGRGTPWFRASDGGACLYGRIEDDLTAEYFRRAVLA